MTNPHDLPFAVEFAGLATAGAGGYGSIAAFEWTDAEGKAVAGTTTWCINPHESDPVAPSAASFMVNSRVEDRRALVVGTATTRRERHDANDTVWPYCRWLALVGSWALSHALTAQPVTAPLRPAFGPFRSGRFQPAYAVERSPSSATLLRGGRSLVNTLRPSRSVDVQASRQRGTIPLMLDEFTRRSRRARR